MNHIKLGEWGEDIACKFLKKRGYVLLFKNWRWKKAELDIITFHKGIIVIIEVKTRSSDLYGRPIESISSKKEAKLREGALAFLEHYDLEYELQFDVISILGQNDEFQVEHIESAF